MAKAPAAPTHADYHQYLQQRSWKAELYRKLWLYPRIARHLSGKVLDVGCGIGDFLAFYKNSIGLEVNAHSVRSCQERGLKAVHLDGARYPFGDGEFEGAILDNVLEHLEDPAPLLAEVRRVLKPKARFVVGVPGRKGYAADPDHKRFYDSAGLKAALEAGGFRWLREFKAPLGVANLHDRIRQGCIYAVFERV